MHRKKLVLSGAVVLVLALVGATVQAAGRFHGGPMKAHVIGFIDEALQKNPLSAQQKQAIQAALDDAAARAQAARADRKGAMDRALQLFEADQLDTAALDKLRSEHMEQASKTFLGVVTEVHDILTPVQRQELVAAIRERAQRHAGHGFGGW